MDIVECFGDLAASSGDSIQLMDFEEEAASPANRYHERNSMETEMHLPCIHCGGVVEEDTLQHLWACESCGRVSDEETLVNRITFEKDYHGRTHLTGMSCELGVTGATAVSGTKGFCVNKSSRDKTFQENKMKLRELAVQNRCDQPDIFQCALDVYRKAYAKCKTTGRSTILSACLFIACRKHGTSHALRDFLPTANGTLPQLERTYKVLVKDLYIAMPPLDMNNQVSRFCGELFAGRSDVSEITAVRIEKIARDIVTRMKRDWIDQGRRSAGVSAAAITIACRMNRVNLGSEIADIAKISLSTIRKRLLEFSQTESGSLKPVDFFARFRELLPARFHPNVYSRFVAEKQNQLEVADRKMYFNLLRKLVRVASIAEDPESGVKFNDKDMKDLQLSLTNLLRTIEHLEHAANPPMGQSLFRGTNVYSTLAEENDDSVLADLMQSMMTNEAEQIIRRENLMAKFSPVLEKRKEAKKIREEKKSTAPPVKRRKTHYLTMTVNSLVYKSPVASAEVPLSPGIDYQRFLEYETMMGEEEDVIDLD